MHRMVFTSIILLFGFASGTSAAESSQTSALPQGDFADEEGETLASINKMPSILGDRESHRRELIKAALEVQESKAKMDESMRWTKIDEYLRAADRIRSSTFTRCNLAMAAQRSGDIVRAAEYFRKEQANPLPQTATEHQKFIRDACDMHAALAYERVGEVKVVAPAHSSVWINHEYVGAAPLAASIFVKPNEEQHIMIELEDKSELKRTVRVKAGKSTTLEFQSAPEPKTDAKDMPKASMSLPPRMEEDPTWKYALAVGGTLLISGFTLSAIGTSMHSSIQEEFEQATGKDGNPCSQSNNSIQRECSAILDKHQIASTVNYTGLGFLGGAMVAGGIALLTYKFPAPRISVALSPNSLALKGSF